MATICITKSHVVLFKKKQQKQKQFQDQKYGTHLGQIHEFDK